MTSHHPSQYFYAAVIIIPNRMPFGSWRVWPRLMRPRTSGRHELRQSDNRFHEAPSLTRYRNGHHSMLWFTTHEPTMATRSLLRPSRHDRASSFMATCTDLRIHQTWLQESFVPTDMHTVRMAAGIGRRSNIDVLLWLGWARSSFRTI